MISFSNSVEMLRGQADLITPGSPATKPECFL
jgi:hypothetical protein